MLDPADWGAFRAASHAALDDALDMLQTVREGPAWRAMPPEAKAALVAAPPQDGAPFDDVYREFAETIAPYPTGNIHPRFFGWVHGTGTPAGVVAEMLAAAMNANVGGREHAAVYVERQVLAWMHELFGMPATASGVLTGGTSTANLIALHVARVWADGARARTRGVDLREPRLVAYASSATHGCIARAFELLGMGTDSLHVVPADARGRLAPDGAAAAIAHDRARGLRPFLLVGNAGTVDNGAIDPLDELADLAAREALWYHVDGAFGAAAILAPSLAPRLKGLERADSLAFDFHKWFHVPYDAGCVLVRDGEAHRAAFATAQGYHERLLRGTSGGEPWFTDLTLDLSRGFRALKVWFTLKHHGLHAIGAAIEANVAQAQQLARAIEGDSLFELLAPVELNVVCLRYRGPAGDAAQRDDLNAELVMRLQESGVAVASTTRIGGQRAIRVCITNHRTRDDDITLLYDTLRRLAADLPAPEPT